MKDEMVLTAGSERKTYVTKMFNSIAHRYDLLNHLLSGGIDIYWRKKAISKLKVDGQGLVLDLATGTGDLAIEVISQKKCKVIGADIALRMLKFGYQKIEKKNLSSQCRFVNADGEGLPFSDSIFNGVTIAFGIRNMGTIPDALAEMYRILKSDGEAIILEFSLPTFRPFRWLYLFYFNKILPIIGNLISKDGAAYSYLPASVEKFPSIGDFSSWMEEAGFRNLNHWKLLNGIAVIYKGTR
ncbi:MAG: bifunctional demethylmenaquinone methyltransferase/2-methoxy-6-polyprenyl-1,4-benzoquinol methylase UbiE [Calditrichaceae bacterium]